MRDFTKLEMWQLGMDIAVEVTEILETIPMTKAGFKIRDQADDAACSIPSNIAEGSSRRSEKEKFRYFEFALGSAFELQTRMLILQRRKYCWLLATSCWLLAPGFWPLAEENVASGQ